MRTPWNGMGSVSAVVVIAVLSGTNTFVRPAIAQRAPSHASTGYNARGIYTLDEFMTITSVENFLWSPDGSVIYYISDAGSTGTSEIFKLSLRDGRTVELTGKHSVSGPGPVFTKRPEPKESLTLTADGKTLYFTSSRFFQRMYNIFSMPAEGGAPKQLTFHDALVETDPAPSPDGNVLAYFARTRSGTKIRLLDLKQRAAWPVLLDTARANEINPVWAPDGKRIAFQRAGDIWIHDLTSGKAERAIPATQLPSNGNPVWSPDGNRLAFTNSASGFSQVGVIDLRTRRVTPITYDQREHSGVTWSPDGRWLAFVRSDSIGMAREIVLAPSNGSGNVRVLVAGKAMRRGVQFSPSGDSIAYIESAPNRTSDIWLIAASGGKPRQLTRSMGKIDPQKLSIPQEVFYPGPDNLRVPALLFLPPSFDAKKKYPVIVSIHGHPGQWNHGMRAISQYFAQKGFVVLAPNPRGSVGFGAGYHDLHVGDHGGAEYEDVISSLKYLATLPYIDTERKASEGHSGGAYMSYVIATHATGAYMARLPSNVNEVFQAQIISAGASSRRDHSVDRYMSPARYATEGREPSLVLEEFGGSYDDIPDRYEERSPINYAERVTVPQLIMTGLRDGSVPHNGSRRWVQRMHELGKSDLVDYVEYPDEDHSLSRYRTTMRDRLERMERFLEAKLHLR